MLIGCGGLFAVLSFGLTLAYLACNNNIVLYQSALPEIIDIFRDLFEILAWAIAFSMLTYAILYRLTKKTRLNLFALLGGILLLRRIFDLAVTLIMYRTISIYDDVIYNLIYWITDLLIVLFAWILTSSTANAYYRRRASKSKSKALFQDNAKIDASTKDFYPFQKIFTKENPLQLCLLKIALLFSASKLLSRLIFDLGYGAPADIAEFFVMLLYYLSDLLCGVIFYTFCILIFQFIFNKIQQKKLDDVN